MTATTSSTDYIRSLSTDDPNNVDTILEVTNTDRDAVITAVQNNADTIFTWDYEKGARPRLAKLYEKSKHSMWDGETDLDWSTNVEIGRASCRERV